MPLNIDVQQILLHALNFVILFGILYFLLYKPVRSFMEKRRQEYEDREKDIQERLRQSEETKKAYEQKLAEVEEEIRIQKLNAEELSKQKAEESMARTQKQAEELLAKSRREAEREKARILADAQKEITGMVAEAVDKLVVSNTSEAFDQFLSAMERSDADA